MFTHLTQLCSLMLIMCFSFNKRFSFLDHRLYKIIYSVLHNDIMILKRVKHFFVLFCRGNTFIFEVTYI